MSLILHPVVIAGDRVSWDRELSPLIAAWLKMMAERDAHQYQEMIGQCITEPQPIDGAVLSRLRARYTATIRLISQLDYSWDAEAWVESQHWVVDLLERQRDNPGTTPETGNPDSDSERPGPGT